MYQYRALTVNPSGNRETVTLEHSAPNVSAINFSRHFPSYTFIAWENQVGEVPANVEAIKGEIEEELNSVGYTAEFSEKYVALLGDKWQVRAIDGRKRVQLVAEGFKLTDLLPKVKGWVKAERFNQQLSQRMCDSLVA